MTENGKGGLEILVHTSAPSRGKDDTHYRALASAYLLFEPVKRLSLHDDNANHQLSASKALVDGQSRGLLSDSTLEELRRGGRKTIIVPDEDIYDVSQSQRRVSSRSHIARSNLDFSLESSQASFSSVLDNLNSPVLLRPGRSIKTPPPPAKRMTYDLVGDNESSWETPPSVIPDSQSPYNRLIPEFSSPTRVLELYLQHFHNSRSISAAADAVGSSQAHDTSSINILLDSSQPPASSPPQTTPLWPPQGINESVRIVRDTPYAEHRGKSKSSRSMKERHPPSPSAAALPRAGYKPIVTRSDRHHVPPADPSKRITASPAHPTPQTSPPHKRQKIEVPATITKPLKRKTFKPIYPPRITPDEIHPSPPRTSSRGSKLPPLITPALQLLATQLELPLRYRPYSQTRPLRILERGFWAVETATWPSTLKEQAWAALGAYLVQGKAGWGVWAVKSGEGKALVGEGGEHAGLRVYCWGGVAGHVYLLLYLVSQRRVKGTGARWLDGGGEVVVCMP
jgi:hypothetical protein